MTSDFKKLCDLHYKYNGLPATKVRERKHKLNRAAAFAALFRIPYICEELNDMLKTYERIQRGCREFPAIDTLNKHIAEASAKLIQLENIIKDSLSEEEWLDYCDNKW